jgi:hypothetical protein
LHGYSEAINQNVLNASTNKKAKPKIWFDSGYAQKDPKNKFIKVLCPFA